MVCESLILGDEREVFPVISSAISISEVKYDLFYTSFKRKVPTSCCSIVNRKKKKQEKMEKRKKQNENKQKTKDSY